MNEPKKEINVESIYSRLLRAVEALPKEAIESASKETTRKGYDTTGYQYQYLVNVMNEVCGIEGWGYDYDVTKELEGKYSNGKIYYDITIDMKVWIAFDEKMAHRSSPGGHQSSSYADAKKGAVTNALKKALGMFGVGKKAYEGTLDEDYRPAEGKAWTQTWGEHATPTPSASPDAPTQATDVITITTKEDKEKYLSLTLLDTRKVSAWDTKTKAWQLPLNTPITLADEGLKLISVDKNGKLFWNLKFTILPKPEVPTVQEDVVDDIPF